MSEAYAGGCACGAIRYEISVVTYGVCGYSWDHVDPGLPKFDKMPT
jgi:hypothetical protein